MIHNFASVVETGNASIAGVHDTSHACIAGVVDSCDAPSETLQFVKAFQGKYGKKYKLSMILLPNGVHSIFTRII
jgi:hypothetical protein